MVRRVLGLQKALSVYWKRAGWRKCLEFIMEVGIMPHHLGRWLTCDSPEIRVNHQSYAYCENRPILLWIPMDGQSFSLLSLYS